MRFALATAFSTLAALMLAAPVLAASVTVPVTLPAGAVACIGLRDAQNYAAYSKSAPKFAEELLARAACYINKEDIPAVTRTVSGDYSQIQLLSGHRVWLASTHLSVK